MNKFYTYISPIALLIVSFGIATLIGNYLVLYAGWVISLIWLNRVARKYYNTVVEILTILLLLLTAVWMISMIMFALAFS